MVIDLILDRKDGIQYDARKFYWDCMEYNNVFHMGTIAAITAAMDYGTNEDVQRAINTYILRNEYNPDICNWVNTQDWLQGA